jgi:hypothetical protein
MVNEITADLNDVKAALKTFVNDAHGKHQAQASCGRRWVHAEPVRMGHDVTVVLDVSEHAPAPCEVGA